MHKIIFSAVVDSNIYTIDHIPKTYNDLWKQIAITLKAENADFQGYMNISYNETIFKTDKEYQKIISLHNNEDIKFHICRKILF